MRLQESSENKHVCDLDVVGYVFCKSLAGPDCTFHALLLMHGSTRQGRRGGVANGIKRIDQVWDYLLDLSYNFRVVVVKHIGRSVGLDNVKISRAACRYNIHAKDFCNLNGICSNRG